MVNNYVFKKKVVNNDEWHIHFLRLNDNTVKITCDLMRPNRKFWQSKFLGPDWTYCKANAVDLLKTSANDIITNYYDQKKNIEKLDDFFLREGDDLNE